MVEEKNKSCFLHNDLKIRESITHHFFSKTTLRANILLLLLCLVLGVVVMILDHKSLEKDLSHKARMIELNIKNAVEDAYLLGGIISNELLRKDLSNIFNLKAILAEKNEALQRKFNTSAVKLEFYDGAGIHINNDGIGHNVDNEHTRPQENDNNPFISHNNMVLDLPIKENNALKGYLRILFLKEFLYQTVGMKDEKREVNYLPDSKKENAFVDYLFPEKSIGFKSSGKLCVLKYKAEYLTDRAHKAIYIGVAFYVGLSLLFSYLLKKNVTVFNKILIEKHGDRINNLSSKVDDVQAAYKATQADLEEVRTTKDLLLKSIEKHNALLILMFKRLQSAGKSIANVTRIMLDPPSGISLEQRVRISENMINKSFLPSGIPLYPQEVSRVGIDEVINEAMAFHGERIFRQNLQVKLVCLPSVCAIESDAMALKLMFVSLLDHAIEAAPKNGFVDVKIEKKGAKLEVSMKDNGYIVDENTIKTLSSHNKPYKTIILGWSEVSKLAEILSADIAISKTFPNGRLVSISFPETIKKEDNLVKGEWDGNVYHM